jgi:hypothetical protein
VNHVQFLWSNFFIFVRGFHPHLVVCLRFSALGSEDFY